MTGPPAPTPGWTARRARGARGDGHLLVHAVGHRAGVSVQNPVRLSQASEPQPDVAVLKPRADHSELWVIDAAEHGFRRYRGAQPGGYLEVEQTDTPGKVRLAAVDVEIDLSGLFV